MRIVEGIKRLSYSPAVTSVAKSLGLRELGRFAYARACGLPRVLTYSLRNIEARFRAHDALELRILEGTWFGEQEMLSGVLSKLAPGDVFLDAGSNLGVFSIFAALAVGPRGTVYAFEPEPVAHGRLLENIRLNHLDNVTVFKSALSDACGNRSLSLDNAYGVNQSSRISEAGDSSKSVETVDFDCLVDHQNLSIPTVVKMDIEGHEYSALQGMRRSLTDPKCVAIFCEVHPEFLPATANTEMILDLIASSGFKIVSKRERSKINLHVIANKN
jgi:FkbM family methyltransferase